MLFGAQAQAQAQAERRGLRGLIFFTAFCENNSVSGINELGAALLEFRQDREAGRIADRTIPELIANLKSG